MTAASRRALRAAPVLRLDSSQSRDRNRWTIRKTSDQLQVSAHRFDIVPQRRDKQVAALLEPGNTVLPNLERPADSSLCQAVGLPKIPERHLFGRKFGRASFNFLATPLAQLRHLVLQGLHRFLSFLS